MLSFFWGGYGLVFGCWRRIRNEVIKNRPLFPTLVFCNRVSYTPRIFTPRIFTPKIFTSETYTPKKHLHLHFMHPNLGSCTWFGGFMARMEH